MYSIKEELVESLDKVGKTLKEIKGFELRYEPFLPMNEDGELKALEVIYGQGNNIEMLEKFLAKLDSFGEHHPECGQAFLSGRVLLDDNSFLNREDYQGSEWWEHVIPPKVEDFLPAKVSSHFEE